MYFTEFITMVDGKWQIKVKKLSETTITVVFPSKEIPCMTTITVVFPSKEIPCMIIGVGGIPLPTREI
jgi:hypothetical protein